MPFKLTVKFTGLCLFARDEQEGCVHVLMPKMPEAGSHEHHAHEHNSHHYPAHAATAYFHKRHAPPLRGKGGSRPTPGERGDHLPQPLDNFSLDLTGLGGAGVSLIPSEILDMGRAVGARVNREVIDDPDRICARVTLAGGKFVNPGPGGWWSFRDGECGPEDTVQMAHYVEWEIDNIGATELGWILKGVGNSDQRRPPALRPDSNGQIELHIMHAETPHPDIPDTTPPRVPDPPDDTHFPVFYRLVTADCTPAPCFERPMERDNKMYRPPVLSNNYTCMSGQAPVGP